jgi:hypothetical protein
MVVIRQADPKNMYVSEPTASASLAICTDWLVRRHFGFRLGQQTFRPDVRQISMPFMRGPDFDRQFSNDHLTRVRSRGK